MDDESLDLGLDELFPGEAFPPEEETKLPETKIEAGGCELSLPDLDCKDSTKIKSLCVPKVVMTEKMRSSMGTPPPPKAHDGIGEWVESDEEDSHSTSPAASYSSNDSSSEKELEDEQLDLEIEESKSTSSESSLSANKTPKELKFFSDDVSTSKSSSSSSFTSTPSKSPSSSSLSTISPEAPASEQPVESPALTESMKQKIKSSELEILNRKKEAAKIEENIQAMKALILDITEKSQKAQTDRQAEERHSNLASLCIISIPFILLIVVTLLCTVRLPCLRSRCAYRVTLGEVLTYAKARIVGKMVMS